MSSNAGLPTELVLSIVTCVVADSKRSGRLSPVLAFASVSRSLHAYILPLVLSILNVRIMRTVVSASNATESVNSASSDASLALLVHSMYDSNFNLRNYIKHLVFEYTGGSLLQLLSPGGSHPTGGERWRVPRITARFCSDVMGLHDASLATDPIDHLIPCSATCDLTRAEDGMYLALARHGHLGDFSDMTHAHLRVWHRKYSAQVGSLYSPKCVVEGVVHRQLDPVQGWQDIVVPENQQGQFIIVEFAADDECNAIPSESVRDLRQLIEQDQGTGQRIVLAYDHADWKANRHVMNICTIVDADWPNQPKTRVRATQKTWDRAVALKDLLLAHAEMVERGEDPWDVGEPYRLVMRQI